MATPNPAGEQVYVCYTLPLDTGAQLELLDQSGKIIEVMKSNEAGARRQELIFQNIPFALHTTGRHKLMSCNPYAGCGSSGKPRVALFELLSDGDVAGDFCYTVDSEDNCIQIDSYNAKTQEIKGSFQLTLANVRKPRSANALPDTLRLRNGRTLIIRYKARGEWERTARKPTGARHKPGSWI